MAEQNTQGDMESRLTDLVCKNMHVDWLKNRKAEIDAENEKLLSEGKEPKPMEHWRPVAKPNKQGEYTAEDSEFIANLEKLDKNKQHNGLRYGENGWELDLLAFDTVEKVGKLSPYWIKQNLDAAKYVVGAALAAERAGGVPAVKMAEGVHNAWGSRVGALDETGWHPNGWSPDAQCRPFEDISPEEQRKDMRHVELVAECAEELGKPLKFLQKGEERTR